MSLIAYLDETGNSSLATIDPDFPVFVLCMAVFDLDHYTDVLIPAVCRFKIDTWGHEGVVLHSRDIRKAQGACWFLRDRAVRWPFYERINTIVQGASMHVFAVAVQTAAHRALHDTRARDPYDLALRFACERVLLLLEELGQSSIRIVAEARTPHQDDLLRVHLRRLLKRGTSATSAERFNRVSFDLRFVPKAANVIGLQLADLMAYPIARHVLNPEATNPAFVHVEPKLWRRGDHRIGLAIYPPMSPER